ncbi:recombinase family protein [Glutamicibacter halophytocola]|uniref:recombinase family protein n=1 Tax=Glutamicibacter halophytocola TaxID=1933880 RepID=UPI001A9CA882
MQDYLTPPRIRQSFGRLPRRTLQLDALTEAGYYRIFTDTVSGALASRPELDELLDRIRPGDRLVVWRLDRFDPAAI